MTSIRQPTRPMRINAGPPADTRADGVGTPFDPRFHWSRALTAERYPRPLSPLGWSNIERVFDEGVRAFAAFMRMPLGRDVPLATSVDGWIFANAEAFDFKTRFQVRLTAREGLSLLLDVWRTGWAARRPARAWRGLIAWLRTPRAQRSKLGSAPGDLAMVVAGGAVCRFMTRIAGDVDRDWPTVLAGYRAEVGRLAAAIAETDDPTSLLALGDELRTAMINYIRPDLVIFAVREIAALLLTELATMVGLADPTRVPALLGSGVHTVTLDLHRRLRDLAAAVGTHPGAAPDAVSAFLREFGHLTCSWDLLHPTWGEDPTAFAALLPHLGAGSVEGDAWAGERRACEAELLRRLREATAQYNICDCGGTSVAVGLARELMAWLRKFIAIDEEHHFYTGLVIPPTRQLVGKIATGFVRRGVLQTPDEVFFLTDGEIRGRVATGDATSASPLAAARRQAWLKATRDGPPVPPPVVAGSGVSRDVAGVNTCGGSGMGSAGHLQAGQPRTWRGLAASAGRARGRVRRLSTVDDLGRVLPGEILMVRSPDPFFSVVYPRMAGLLADTGALLSHGAVVAREYRLPAVLGLQNAFDVLADGMMVELDGTTGEVRCLAVEGRQ